MVLCRATQQVANALGEAGKLGEVNAHMAKMKTAGLEPDRCVTAKMKKIAIVTLGLGTGRQRMVLERWTNPKPQRRTYSSPGTEYHRVEGNRWASRNGPVSDPPDIPHVTIFATFSSLHGTLSCGGGPEAEVEGGEDTAWETHLRTPARCTGAPCTRRRVGTRGLVPAPPAARCPSPPECLRGLGAADSTGATCGRVAVRKKRRDTSGLWCRRMNYQAGNTHLAQGTPARPLGSTCG